MAHPLIEYLEKNRDKISSLLILTHDHPDPDAMASAFGLLYLAHEKFGIRSRIVYGGMIGRAENQLMKTELKIPLHQLRKRDLDRHSNIALVDCQPTFANNPFPKNGRAHIVIDHHPKDRKMRSDFSVIKPHYGATSTIITEALLEASIRIPRNLKTALVYGISSETQNLGREASPEDMQAYMNLRSDISTKILARIKNPPRSDDFFLTINHAIQNAFICGRIIGVHLGRVKTPDLVSQTADFLLSCHGKTWSLCTGRYQNSLHISLRTSNVASEAGKLLKKIVADKGQAGGHDMIAGGAIPVKTSDDSTWKAQEDLVTAGLIQILGYKREAPFDKAFKNT
jgi:nanoRNase/pAp phosphatase (c-di-AMP/oligoRNAs hydrolase)